MNKKRPAEYNQYPPILLKAGRYETAYIEGIPLDEPLKLDVDSHVQFRVYQSDETGRLKFQVVNIEDAQ